VDDKIKQKVHKIQTNHHNKNKRKYSRTARFAQEKMGGSFIIWRSLWSRAAFTPRNRANI